MHLRIFMPLPLSHTPNPLSREAAALCDAQPNMPSPGGKVPRRGG